METTDNLELPYLMPSQAQKHVTHNEALAILDAIVQFAVIDRDLAAPPGAPSDGDRYIVATGASGAWSGKDGKVAVRRDGDWSFLEPKAGWLAYVADEGIFIHFSGSAWASLEGTMLTPQNLALLGVGTTADATNPFAAKLNKALWTARTASEGGDGDLRYTMNKETASDVVSVLFQSGWSGRAEFGLIGDDNLAFKVSPNGSAWTTALTIDKTSGTLRTVAGSASTPAVQVGEEDTGFYSPSSDTIGFATGGVVRGVLDSSGRFVWGSDASIEVLSANVQFLATSAPGSSVGLARFTNGANGPYIRLAHSRGASIGTNTVLNNNDELGNISFMGVGNAGGMNESARFRARVVGTPSTDRPAARFDFMTSDGSATPAVRVSISETGAIQMGTSADTVINSSRHFVLRSYTVSTLPSAATAGQMIYVSDGSSNRRLAISDGTNWRFPDGNVVS